MFVVGMPRSGTTLVEQILSSHPSIHGAGELPDLRRIMFAMPKAAQTATSFPYCMASLDGTVGRDTAGQYLDKLISFAPDALRITDKMPWNVFVLGMIALFYPKARVIHCRRDPMDTCVSCYTQCFAANQPFSWDLADLGDYYRQYDRLTEHWRRVLPVQVFEVQYERLVEAPQEVVRELIDFSGLPWDDACLEFHRSKRPTRTNPTQVRQPIYKTSIDRWRCYESHLEPLRRALAGDLTDG